MRTVIVKLFSRPRSTLFHLTLQLVGVVRSRLGVLRNRLPLWLEVAILLFTASMATAWLDIEFRPRIVQLLLPTARIVLDKGQAYVTKIANPGLRLITEIVIDSGSAPTASSVELYENGKPLGPSHSRRENIRDIGQGAFSYQRQGLYFSTSDGSSPLTNGRVYSVRFPVTPTPFLRWLVVLAFLIMLWRAYVYLPLGSQIVVETGLLRSLRWAVTPAQFGGHWVVSVMTALVLVGAVWIYLISLWESAHTISSAIGGFFQVSDASNYAGCANQILDKELGRISGWCLRRPTYPVFLATLLAITGRNWLGLLLLQSVFVVFSVTVLFRAVCRLAGPLVALCVLCFTFAFAAEHAIPLTLTENLGLALGAVGLALLLDSARLADKRLLFFAAACLTLALNARAGAFFVLPMLLAAIFFQSVTWRSRWFSTAIVVAGIVCGFALHLFLIAHLGGYLSASHSNFAHTLYGLSIGGKGWSQVYTDHAELFSAYPEAEAAQLVYQLALTNIVNSPQLFVKALIKNSFLYLKAGPLGMTGLRLLWWIGAWAIAIRWRDVPYRIIGLISVGILLSAPFIVQDGRVRVFAATWGITGLQIGLGLHFLLNCCDGLVNQSRSTDGYHHLRPQPFDIIMPVILLVTILLPLTPLRGLAATKPVPAQGCKVGEKELIARLGHESYMIILLGAGQPKSLWRLQVSAEELRKNIPSWFDRDFAALPVPITLINGYQTMAGNIGDDIRVAWNGDLGEFYGKTVSICFKTDASVSVAANPYYHVVSVRPIAP